MKPTPNPDTNPSLHPNLHLQVFSFGIQSRQDGWKQMAREAEAGGRHNNPVRPPEAGSPLCSWVHVYEPRVLILSGGCGMGWDKSQWGRWGGSSLAGSE